MLRRPVESALLADLDSATQEFGLAVTGGHVSHTGVAGLTLGGGMGWLMRKHGLTIDSLLSAELVTADGSIVVASESENPDLFWGLRGGGGNFGVVTAFTFRLHEVGPILIAGSVLHPLERAAEALRFAREFVANAPDELGVFAVLITVPPAEPFPPELQGRPALALGIAYAGPVEDGAQVIRPLRQFGPPALDLVSTMPYLGLQTMLDETAPSGLRYYNTAHYLRGLEDDAIETVVGHFAEATSPLSQVIIGWMGGAVARVPVEATAFGHRRAPYLLWIVGAWSDGDAAEHVAWTREFGNATRRFSTGGVYVNALGNEGASRVQAAYDPHQWNRLVALKDRYDPYNVFHLNQNIRPSVLGSHSAPADRAGLGN